MSDNFVFDGRHSLDNMGIYVDSITRPLFAEPKTVYEDIPGADGELNFTTDNLKGRMCFKPRIIELECHFAGYDKTRERYIEKISNLANWLTTSENKRLTFDSEPNVYYMAHVANLFNVQDITDCSGTFPLVFKCEPFRYGVEQLACSGTDGVGTTNLGYYTPFVIWIDGNATDSIKITHNQTGKTFSINTPFDNSRAIIDTENMTATMNGISILHKCEGDFFELVPGINSISVDYGEGGSGDITIMYSERFL
ncbi:MAG: phage tail family protein [Clostridia bacterium]|nr:phage tail family protein [Clostridia bacterium]